MAFSTSLFAQHRVPEHLAVKVLPAFDERIELLFLPVLEVELAGVAQLALDGRALEVELGLLRIG
jgi:hypothetical protein